MGEEGAIRQWDLTCQQVGGGEGQTWEGVSLFQCTGAKLCIARCSDFGHFLFGDGNHLPEKLKLEPGILVHIVDVQAYLVAATRHAVENPGKCAVGFLFVAQM
jgi:hypothetical protein